MVLGIDPSLTATGIAHSNGSMSTISTNAKAKDERLDRIYWDVRHSGRADFCVMEDLPKHAMAAGITGMVQGVVRLALIHENVPYLTIPPATLKKFATGKGNCDKAAMRQAWLMLTGEDNADDNQVDAAYLRQIGLYLTGQLTLDIAPEQLLAVARYQEQADDLCKR
jgi:Holliday junction resolvasome RuvABC endonuclease subunit